MSSDKNPRKKAPARFPLDPMLRVPEILLEMGWKSRTTLYTRIRDGEFPPLRELGSNAVGLPMSVVRAERDKLPQRTYQAQAVPA